jgi:hypothetical protein
MRARCLVLAVILLAVTTAEAKIVYVAQSGNNSTGLSWAAAFQTCQPAIDAATDGDEIWIEEGTYYLKTRITVNKQVKIFGGFAGDEPPSAFSSRNWWERPTIIDGGSGVGPCFSLYNANDCLLDGLVVQRAFGPAIGSRTATLRNCILRENYSNAFPAAIQSGPLGVLEMENCLIYDNEARYPGYVHNPPEDLDDYPAAIECYSSLVMNNCTIADNRVVDYNFQTFPSFSTIVFDGDMMTVRSSIIRGKIKSFGDPTPLSISYSNVSGNYPGEGNIDMDPLFNPFAYGLMPSSPCVDSATVGPSLDLSHDFRPVDVPGVGRDGAYAYDMGVFELQLDDFPAPTPTQTPAPTPAPTPTMNPHSDVDQDGRVGIEDLLMLIQDWQKVSGP